jgi:hypothetical protein
MFQLVEQVNPRARDSENDLDMRIIDPDDPPVRFRTAQRAPERRWPRSIAVGCRRARDSARLGRFDRWLSAFMKLGDALSKARDVRFELSFNDIPGSSANAPQIMPAPDPATEPCVCHGVAY